MSSLTTDPFALARLSVDANTSCEMFAKLLTEQLPRQKQIYTLTRVQRYGVRLDDVQR